MKKLIKYFKYQYLLYRLDVAKSKEYEIRKFYNELGIFYDDLNMRSINKAIAKAKDKWRSR